MDVNQTKTLDDTPFHGEEQFHYLLENISDVIFYLDRDGIVISASPSTSHFLGFPPEKYIGTPVFLDHYLLNPADLEQQLHEIIVSQKMVKLELKYLHHDGHFVYHAARGVPMMENGTVNRIVLATREITDRKQAQYDLLQTQQELKDTLREQQGMTFKIKKINGRFIHTMIDGELCYRMGLDPERDIIGKALEDFFPLETAIKKTKYYQSAWEGNTVNYEGNINGIFYLASLRPLYRHGQVQEVIASCVDITERKCVEEALRKSEEKYRFLTEHMNDVLCLLNPCGVFEYVSPSIERTLGYHPESLLGNLAYDMMHPEDSPLVREKMMALLHTRKEQQVTFRFRHANGQWIDIESKGVPILDESGDVIQIHVVNRDITERKKTEEWLRNTEKLTVIGELAAGIAHEIRNPLTSLRGFIQLLQNQIRDCPEYFRVMLSELDRINFIVSELLVLAKPQVVDFKQNNLFELLHNVIRLLGTQAILNNVEIITKFHCQNLWITYDENRMKQVFINVIKNAIESMPDGGILIIETRETEADQVQISFIDNGCGIPEDLIPKLGEPFYTTKEKGTGLGLMVSNKIMQDHDGQILITSQMNKGTTVDVLLPLTL